MPLFDGADFVDALFVASARERSGEPCRQNFSRGFGGNQTRPERDNVCVVVFSAIAGCGAIIA